MVRMLKETGAVQWIGLIISVGSAVAMCGGMIWKVGVIQTRMTTDCEQIKSDIKRIDSEGTIKARQSEVRIATLEAQYSAILQRLSGIESSVQKTNDNLLDLLKAVQRRPPSTP